MADEIRARSFLDLSQDQTNIDAYNENYSFINETCVPLKENYLLGVVVIPALVVIENLFILLAMFCYRMKLKHSNVYRYVASALIANVVTSTLGFYHFLNYYYGFEPTAPNPWWAFRKGMTLALSLVMCGNIGLLIYGIEGSTYIVGRVSKSNDYKQKLDPKFRRRKANILICTVWALPTVYGLLAMTSWNCTSMCDCTLSYASGKAICPEGPCSRLYTPMSKSYLLVVVILWGLECLGLLVLLSMSIRKVRQCNDLAASNSDSGRRRMSLRRTLHRHRSSHQVVYLLFLLFLLCTGPVMIMLVLDFGISGIHFSNAVINFITPLPLLYCLVSPILVSYKLSGVKQSFLMAISCSWFSQSLPARSIRYRKKSSSTVVSV